ncbi:MAG: putative glycolipid-binding domain-containing protein [Acidimicrobiia bacterium]
MREQEQVIRWASWDGTRVETLTIGWENNGWTADGIVEAGEDSIHYAIRTDAEWNTRQFLLFRDLEDPDLWLANDGRGTWGEVNGSVRSELRNCTDVDLVATPFSKSLPIKRLGLPVNESIEIWTVWVDPGTLTVMPAHQRYSHLAERTWRFEALLVEFSVEFEVDEYGFVVDFPGAFRRL